jgi:hypothetical protein
MAQKRKPDQTKLVEAVLTLADHRGWERLSFKDIAKKSGTAERELAARFSDVWDLVRWVLKTLDAEARRIAEGGLGDDWRDNLGEILMLRFEMAQRHRKAFSTLAPALAKHPRVMPHFMHGFYRALDGMLEQAGLDRKPCHPLCIAAFGAVYLSVAEAWLRDETRDLSKTMAAIDRRLDLFEKALEFFEARRPKRRAA